MQSIEIRVTGHIDESWTSWFDGLTISHTEQGETILKGFVADQATLYGVLARLRDLGLPLLSVNHIEVDDPRPNDQS